VHETGAAIIKNGKILAAVNEDRITGIKHDGSPPVQSIKEVLRISQVRPQDIDAIAISQLSPGSDYVNGLSIRNPVTVGRYPYLKGKERHITGLLNTYGIHAPIYYVKHHLAHAAGTYYTSGFKDALIVTIDGVGDSESTTISRGEGGMITQLKSYPERASLGHFYAKATVACGFKAHDGEGKTMGLAAYAKSNPELNERVGKMMTLDGLEINANFGDIDGSSKVDVNDLKPFAPYRYDTSFLSNNQFLGLKGFKKNSIANAAQFVLEEVAANLCQGAMIRYGMEKLCLSGGVALNVKMNKRIRERISDLKPMSEATGDMFIHPNPGDPGLPVGAAMYVCNQMMLDQGNRFKPWRMDHVYYGSSFSTEYIEKEINKYGLEYYKTRSPWKDAADIIAEGKVIGWFQGNQEYGPRALGHRSVLADPTVPGTKDRINKHLKKRDWFMPFCPSMLYEAIDEYLIDPTESPFMIMTFEMPEKKAKRVPEIVHVDGTIRPQTVKKTQNLEYWKLIREFERKRGVPIILNTSFNKHGLPMIMSPEQALNHLVWGCVEALVMDRFVISRKFKAR
jgi:carbamoyltransferase